MFILLGLLLVLWYPKNVPRDSVVIPPMPHSAICLCILSSIEDELEPWMSSQQPGELMRILPPSGASTGNQIIQLFSFKSLVWGTVQAKAVVMETAAGEERAGV
jgi:hypothetical protein